MSNKSTQQTDFFVDFPALCRGRSSVDEIEESAPRNPMSVARPWSTIDRDPTASLPIWGESWYLSYVVHTTNNERSHLWQPIFNKSHEPLRKEVSPAPTQRATTTVTSSNNEAFNAPSLDLPSRALVDELVHEYFTTFHRFCPIIRQQDFVDSIKVGNVPSVLLHCVLFIASIHCDLGTIHRLGYRKRIEAEDDLFNKARAAFDADLGSDRLAMLQSCYLLHYWTGKPSTHKDSLWWLAGAIRSAQGMGMHRAVGRRPMLSSRKSIWRRTWWLLYVRHPPSTPCQSKLIETLDT